MLWESDPPWILRADLKGAGSEGAVGDGRGRPSSIPPVTFHQHYHFQQLA